MSLHAEDFLSEREIELLLLKRGIVKPAKPTKKHKYGAKRVTVDGINFPSMLEARCYTDLKLQYQGNLITEPLRQVWFSLGEHYGKEKYYVADFVYIILKSQTLVVLEAKGHKTEIYKQKKATFANVYRLCITEYSAY